MDADELLRLQLPLGNAATESLSDNAPARTCERNSSNSLHTYQKEVRNGESILALTGPNVGTYCHSTHDRLTA